MAEQILVIKHGAFGDVVQGFDAFSSLRTSFPEAKITVLTTAPYAGLLRASGWFDEVILDARAPAWKLMQLWQIRSVFRQNWDKIIDLQCSRRTARYARLYRTDTRWFGTASGASDPMPDFSGVNNRNRMLTAVKMAGAQEHEDELSFCGLLICLLLSMRLIMFFCSRVHQRRSRQNAGPQNGLSSWLKL